MRLLINRIYCLSFVLAISVVTTFAQINTDRVMNIGRNALYYEDYVLSIQYFNQVIAAKPYLAEPYFFRSVAKYYLEDYIGAEEDASACIERNPFKVDAYEVRGISRQALNKNSLAIQDYDKGLENKPEDKRFLFNKAIALTDDKQYDEALKTYDSLLKIYPKFDNGYYGRSILMAAKGDTIAAIKDLDTSIELNKNVSRAYAQRAILNMSFNKDRKLAISDLNEAIKLEPKNAVFYINRAFIRYGEDDFRGAMSDYDLALELEPDNQAALYNRGLLRAQVRDNNRAISDFTAVINADSENYYAVYNRGLLRYKIGEYRKAISDFDIVLKEFPDFEAGFFARSECKRALGDMKGGAKDYDKSLALQRNRRDNPNTDDASNHKSDDKQKENINKFADLLNVKADNSVSPQYENQIRGRIQNYNVTVSPEPMYVLTYYDKNDGLRQNIYFSKEIDEVNDLRIFPYLVVLTNKDATLNSDQVSGHFKNIEKNTAKIKKNDTALNRFVRAMDYMMVLDYEQAVADLDVAIEKNPQFMLAYFARAVSRFRGLEGKMTDTDNNNTKNIYGKSINKINISQSLEAEMKRKDLSLAYSRVISDLKNCLSISPRFVYAIFNMGNAFFAQGDNDEAINQYTNAINMKPDFAEAYFNRGLAYLRIGVKDKGTTDLSKAGELGITQSYNILKRMNK